MNWQERAEKAEAELANLAKQEPVAYVKYKTTGGNVGLAWMAIPTAAFYPREGEKLYVTPVPVPHKGATHCDGCGMTWLDDGLNPLGCPYCITNHNARRYLALRESGVMVSGHDFVKFDWSLDAAADRLLEGGK